MVQENRTEYFEISTSSWDNIVIEMENGQETSMNPLGVDSPLYTDLARLEVVDTYILNLSTDNFYNISLEVPHNADLDMHLAGPTSGGPTSPRPTSRVQTSPKRKVTGLVPGVTSSSITNRP